MISPMCLRASATSRKYRKILYDGWVNQLSRTTNEKSKSASNGSLSLIKKSKK